jgi:glycerol uptake facilitator protein
MMAGRPPAVRNQKALTMDARGAMSNLSVFLGEYIGTALLLLLGNGVCAAVTLEKSKARGAGWLVICFGWGFAVMVAAYVSAPLSGAHLNPAVTIGVSIKSGDWSQVPIYLAGQFLGAISGAFLCWLSYLGQFNLNSQATLGIFATSPEIRNPRQNLMTEIIATFVLIYFILVIGDNQGLKTSASSSLLVAFLVVGLGLSLGGPTGYAVNPARDLGPRLVHSLLPIPHKGTSDWGYAYIPIIGPSIGALLAGFFYRLVFHP